MNAKNTTTAATTSAVKPSIKERLTASWSSVVAVGPRVKSFCVGLVPSYKLTAALGTLCFLLLVGAALVNGMEANKQIVASTAATHDRMASAVEERMAVPSVGQRIYSAGQTVYGYTVQPVVSADGAVKNRLFGEAPAATVPSSLTITVK